MKLKPGLYLLYLLIFSTSFLYGQTPGCSVDPDIPVGDFGIFPTTFDLDFRPDGGIHDTVVLNQDFEFTFNVKIEDTWNSPIGSIPLESLTFATSSAITYTPDLSNFDYVCNPPNCVFLPNQTGCIKIFGKEMDANTLGVHDLNLVAIVYSSPGIQLPVTFPEIQDGGQYLIVVKQCLANLNLESLIESQVYRASNKIAASGTVPSGNFVHFKAGNEVELLPSFTIEIGADLNISIEACASD